MNKFQEGAGLMKWLTEGKISKQLSIWGTEGGWTLNTGFPVLPEISIPLFGIEEAERLVLEGLFFFFF